MDVFEYSAFESGGYRSADGMNVSILRVIEAAFLGRWLIDTKIVIVIVVLNELVHVCRAKDVQQPGDEKEINYEKFNELGNQFCSSSCFSK